MEADSSTRQAEACALLAAKGWPEGSHWLSVRHSKPLTVRKQRSTSSGAGHTPRHVLSRPGCPCTTTGLPSCMAGTGEGAALLRGRGRGREGERERERGRQGAWVHVPYLHVVHNGDAPDVAVHCHVPKHTLLHVCRNNQLHEYVCVCCVRVCVFVCAQITKSLNALLTCARRST